MLRDKLAQSRLRIWQAVDAELQRLLAGLDLSRTTVVVVSDHGMMPIHTVVDPQAVLAEAGLLGEKEAEERGHSSRPVARSIAGGGVAHIYFEKAGDEVLANVARRYSEWRIDGEEPVEKVYRRSEAAQIGLDHPNSGDLILFAREGYAFRGLPEGKAFAPTPTYGMHGHLNTHPEVHAIYLAIGAGVKPGSAGTLRSTDVAPRVAAWLRISPPSRTVQTRQK
jgi:predicted AlkP superfamily pyrophosphatase or phosphodiesterase